MPPRRRFAIENALLQDLRGNWLRASSCQGGVAGSGSLSLDLAKVNSLSSRCRFAAPAAPAARPAPWTASRPIFQLPTLKPKKRVLLKAVVVIPTYNERDNLERLARLILSQDASISLLVVDDNSPDGTGALADRLAAETGRVSVLHRAGKLGLGSAYREGFKLALAMGADLVVQMDADFSHDPAILPVFFQKMQECDLVIGSRYLNGISVVNWPLRRLMLSYFASFYTRVITGLSISDCTSGFKCFSRSALEAIDLDRIRSDGYSFQIEMNYRCVELGFRVAEVPIIFIDRHAGTSKMSKRIVREAVLMVWKLKLGSLVGRLLPKGRP
jgi:dolichol-phosphate mannosyltransferase